MTTLPQIKPINATFQSSGSDVFSSLTRMAQRYNSINLGQGAPESGPIGEMTQLAAQGFLKPDTHQYAHPDGTAEFRQAISQANAHFYGLRTDPEEDLLVVNGGATAALNMSLRVLLEREDEVVLFEPFYNFYDPLIRTAGGTPQYVSLTPPAWSFDEANLRSVITEKTKVILLNSPMNPTGKVFSRQELSVIAGIAREHDLYVICDDAYEFFTPENNKHIPLSTLDGMQERCIRISSAGKTFSCTGWRVGYLSAPKNIMPLLKHANTLTGFSVPRPLQTALTHGLQDYDYLGRLGGEFNAKAGVLSDGLNKAGFDVLPYSGGYFVCADFSRLKPQTGSAAFSEYLTREIGVTAMPLQPFYNEIRPEGDTLLRFCVAKSDDTLGDAIQRLDLLSA